MGVYLGVPHNDYSAMQGPAPSGFHIPLTTEWKAVYDIWTALGGGSSDGTNFGIALKLPFAGDRGNSSSNVYGQGTYGRYWSSTRSNENDAYRLYFSSSNVSPQSYNRRAYGHSVRCFKDTTTIPTSSWTKLYGTSIEAGGIFWSSTDGLISLSSDGQTWVTIADKNLGATTVWNSGDTLSEANCGKYYQRGNNYGFPRTGSVTTSSTQVNASNYGPGNYYSSSTFITRSSSPYRWDSTDNGNLWGGVTGVVLVPTTELKNAYIGGIWWRPSSATIGYRELNGNAEDTKNDYGVTTYTTTNYDANGYEGAGYPTYVAGKDGKRCAYFDGTRGLKLPALPNPSNKVTFSVRVKINSLSSDTTRIFQFGHDTSSYPASWCFLFSVSSDGARIDWVGTTASSGTTGQVGYSTNKQAINTGERYNLVGTFNAGTMKFYINGVLKETKSGNAYLRNYGNREGGFGFTWNKDNTRYYLNGYIQDMIYDNKVWSESEVFDYYNMTK